jgi:outer membrane biosynthesis protein TonB
MDAAVALVAGWRYEPPTQGGQSVLVEVRETVIFHPRGE